MGGDRAFGGGIAYVTGETAESNTLNGSLNVEADDQSLYLRSIGMARFGAGKSKKLSFEGAAEFYWSLFIERLQQR